MQAFAGYTIEALQPGLWAIDDEKGDSMYLIEGTERALLIDTGLQAGDIHAMLRTLTDKPIDLALTHAHVDHMFHADAFETVYLHEADIAAWRWPLGPTMWAAGFMMKVRRKRYRVQDYRPLREGTVIDLGGVQISVVLAKGHTPGSVCFVDAAHRTVFTGDAIGSGGGVWLFLPACTTLSVYRESLAHVLEALAPCRDFRFEGGHRQQGIPTAEYPHSTPLTYQTLIDLHTLCGLMLDRKITPEREGWFGPIHIFTYRHESGAIVERIGNIR